MAATRSARPRTSAVVVRRPDAAIWREALSLAHGDHRRLEIQVDGSVVVHNQPVR
jgi:hypothetical protein